MAHRGKAVLTVHEAVEHCDRVAAVQQRRHQHRSEIPRATRNKNLHKWGQTLFLRFTKISQRPRPRFTKNVKRGSDPIYCKTSRSRVISAVRSRGWLPTKNPRVCAIVAFSIPPTMS